MDPSSEDPNLPQEKAEDEVERVVGPVAMQGPHSEIHYCEQRGIQTESP
jgi:hypothetical protein